jgi:hypothetical protein
MIGKGRNSAMLGKPWQNSIFFDHGLFVDGAVSSKAKGRPSPCTVSRPCARKRLRRFAPTFTGVGSRPASPDIQ